MMQGTNDQHPFDDATGLGDGGGLAPIAPDPAQIALFAEAVFSWCEGLIPLRGIAEKGLDLQPAPENVWCTADGHAAQAIALFAQRAFETGRAAYAIPGTVAGKGQARAADVQQMQAIVVDLDGGDIEAIKTHLLRHLGQPTLVVASGGRTAEGHAKLHLWWKLTEPAVGADVERLCRLRGDIAIKVGGDRHFASAHQPIRIPGSVYRKNGVNRLVLIRDHAPVEYDLAEFASKVAEMPPLPGVAITTGEEAFPGKPGVEAVLTTPVREGDQDGWSRFQGASAAIGHFLRMVHDGRMAKAEGWTAICGYNAAMLRPPWPLERLKAETARLWALHIENHGPEKPQLAPAPSASSKLEAFSLGKLLDDDREMPADLIAPRVLTPGGMLVLGGAPKVGKSDFLISWLVHMAAGVPFLGFTPPRPLRVFYLQAEIQYDYLRERMKQIALPPAVIAAARDTFVATPKLNMLLDASGVACARDAISAAFKDTPPDIICIDPIRNLFDGGPPTASGGGGENDNNAMMFFLKDRVEALRDAINPDAGIILAHHTRKAGKQQVKDDPFQALSGASSLRGFYTSGLLMHRPDEDSTVRRLEIELRNGPAIPAKVIDKIKGRWVELDPTHERLVRAEVSAKHDAERLRKHDVILTTIFEEAARGNLYSTMQFAEQFENKGGLGSKHTIRDRIGVLSTKGHVKFLRDATSFGFPRITSRSGYLCVEGMRFKPQDSTDPETGEVIEITPPVLPSHYKCPQSGVTLDVENPTVWVYPEAEKEAPATSPRLKSEVAA